MSIKNQLDVIIKEVTKKVKEDATFRKAIVKFYGRTLILDIIGEERYSFNITSKEINLKTETAKPKVSKDLYVKTDKERILRIMRQRKIRLADLPHIEHRNIKIKDVKLAKKLLNW